MVSLGQPASIFLERHDHGVDLAPQKILSSNDIFKDILETHFSDDEQVNIAFPACPAASEGAIQKSDGNASGQRGRLLGELDIWPVYVTLGPSKLHRGAMLFRNSVISLLNSPLKLKIIAFLIKKDVLMSEREISRLLDVSHMSVNRTMQKLEEINFVHPGRVGRAHVWKVNRRSYAFQVLSQVVETFSSVDSPLDVLKATILANLPLPAIEKLVLFGSVAKQDERLDSDIDIFILVKDESVVAEIQASVEALSLICLERFGNALSPYVLTRKGLREKAGLKLVSELDSGIVLHEQSASDVP
jgi:hypothetical protein